MTKQQLKAFVAKWDADQINCPRCGAIKGQQCGRLIPIPDYPYTAWKPFQTRAERPACCTERRKAAVAA